MKKPEVIFFQRKPYLSGNYSVEYIFEDLRNRLRHEINARTYVSTFYSRGILRRLYNSVEAVFRQGEVNFITGDIHYISMFLPKKRTVLTILDCGFIYQNTGIKRWLEKIFWITIPVNRVRYITTISESSKNDILKIVNCDPDKIFVIPVSVDRQYKYYPKEFNENLPVLLHIGQAKNKNLTRIIEAVKGLRVQLSIVGRISPHHTDLLQSHSINYTNCFNISNQEMLNKYIDSDVLLFPSTYEGFGMPILEAQSVGRPVITSSVTSMPWVAGDGACLVDPFSVESIREGVIKVLNSDEYRCELVSNGLENIRRFDPDAIANMYFDVIQKIASNQ